MSSYMPVYQYPDMMPVDISFVFADEMPAGKHGFCHVDGENFRFDDGTLAKFWGVIFNGASCFPSHAYAEGVARRLSQAGCNIVRFHQMDAEWATPNLFRFTAGKRMTTTRHLDPESMERLDYLIKCLKERGIYAAVDMTTYRKFKSGDGVACANELKDNHKQYAVYDPVMIELQKEFCTNFWNHQNPYTGLAYKDDPFFVFCDITNENDLFVKLGGQKRNRIAYYDDLFRKYFAQWLQEQNISDYDAATCDLDAKDEIQMNFRIELNRRFARTMYDHLRSLGVKIPICCSNDGHGSAFVKAQEDMDFQDGHCYFYDWSWTECEKVSNNKSLMDVQFGPLGMACSTRLHGQPFVMTEWDMPWPNSYRAEGPMWFPAMACLQNWSSMTIHTYGYHTRRNELSLLGKESSSSALGTTPFREGLFTCWNDPAKFGLFYHGALMLRRGDVKPASHVVGAQITSYSTAQNALASSLMETHQVHAVLDTTDTSDLTDLRPADVSAKPQDPNRIVSDTGEVWRDRKRRVGGIDTAMTKAVFGVLGPRTTVPRSERDYSIRLNGMVVDAYTDFATVALSSLTADPIEKSDNLLLSTVGRARNHGQQMDGEKLVDIGTHPIEAEVIDAEISFRTERGENLRVWGINSEGFYAARIEATYEDGWFKFRVGPHYPCLYYLIMEE